MSIQVFRGLLPATALSVALCGALVAGLFPTATLAERTAAPEGAKVYIISPKDGETVPQTFKVQFGLSGMGVAPAGADLPKTGHHHLLIDLAELPPLDQPLGKEIMHFGGGQTEASVTLPPGPHTLQLMLGDKNHVPFDPPVVSEKVHIQVQ
jgi:hypothetical protein